MTLKCFYMLTLLLAYFHFNIAYSKNIIQIDFKFPSDVPNHNHNVSSTMPQYESLSSRNRKLTLNHGIIPRNKVYKAKSRSLAGK